MDWNSQKANGTGGESIYGEKFEDEFDKGYVKHSIPGLLSMANAGVSSMRLNPLFLRSVGSEWSRIRW